MKGRELKEILKAEDKDLRDELEKYKGLYDKYRNLYTDVKYKYDCLEYQYNIEKKENDDTEFYKEIKNTIKEHSFLHLLFYDLSTKEEVAKLIKKLIEEYKYEKGQKDYYSKLYFEWGNKSSSFNGSSNDIFSRNKDKWKKLLKDMAMKYHPDHGGDHNMMIFVNEVRKELKEIL